jgi:dihydroorotase-like cyclic amidohydrolase
MSGQIIDAGLAIDDGRIVAISKESHLPSADETVRLKGWTVMPGGVDIHPHLFDPEFMGDREDFESGSRAAAMGGVTSIVEMPTRTACLAKERMECKIKEGENRSYIDFGLHSGNVRTLDDLENIDDMMSLGICSFKAFSCSPDLAELTCRAAWKALKARRMTKIHIGNSKK